MSADFWLGVLVGVIGLCVMCLTLVGALHLLDLRVSSGQKSTPPLAGVVPLQRVGR